MHGMSRVKQQRQAPGCTASISQYSMIMHCTRQEYSEAVEKEIDDKNERTSIHAHDIQKAIATASPELR